MERFIVGVAVLVLAVVVLGFFGLLAWKEYRSEKNSRLKEQLDDIDRIRRQK